MEYKNIKECQDLVISSNGQLKNIKTGKFRTPSIDKDGYLRYTLKINGKTTTRFAHRLVAEAFISNPNNLPCVNHKDENKKNNNVENLEWCNYNYNDNYGTRNARIARIGKDNYNHKAIAMCDKQTHKVIQVFDSIADALEFLGKNRTNTYAISKVCKNPKYSAYGYWWKYI